MGLPPCRALLYLTTAATAQNLIHYAAPGGSTGITRESGRARVNIAVSPHHVRPTFRKPFYQKPKTDPASLKKACKASIKEAWRPKTQKVGYTYHKNACSRDARASQRRTWQPARCPHVTPSTAKKCLAKKNITRIVLIGDSLTMQLWGSLLCREETKWGFGAKVDGQIQHENVNYDQRSQRGFSVADATVGDGLTWTYLRVRGMQRAGALTRALEVAFDRGMLDQRALYVVNAGLWHLLCTTNINECLETYENDVDKFLKVLTARADGPVVWRYTTAVHPALFPRRMSPVDQRKFRSFTDENVRRLNKVADTVIRRDFRDKVTVRRDAYNFTVNLEDEAYLRGDARHPASGALKSLVSLLFVEDACDYGRLARGLVGRWWQDW
ncbi:unnamed protein product [Pelagomonas calceolata]|uniref:Uncharacterized protein n=1 Tax=Pelagomonas calceolata TaxID=35677 RepID=A0A8J2S913_9STRA|nr:unnamed protein product [Pelagomonas calceolata]